MVTGGGWGDSGRKKPGWGLGKVEEVPGKVLARGIEVWWPEEGDRRKEATAARADELRSSLVDVRRKNEEMTGGYHNQINIWVLSGRTVRRPRADCPRGRVLHCMHWGSLSRVCCKWRESLPHYCALCSQHQHE